MKDISRRTMLKRAGVATGIGVLGTTGTVTAEQPTRSRATRKPDWPQYQYDATNVGSRIGAVGPETSPTIAWQTTLPGSLRSSPALVNNTIYVGAADGLHGFHAKTGRQRLHAPLRNVSRSSPAVIDQTAYIGSTRNRIYAVSTKTGELDWEYETEGGIYHSPTVAEGRVFVTDNAHHVYAIDVATGRLDWSFETANAWSRSAPAVHDGTVYIGNGVWNDLPAYVYAINAETGEERWRFTHNPPEEPRAGGAYTPTIVGDTVYVGAGYRLYALSTEDGSVRWEVYSGGSFDGASPTLVDGTVYAGGDGANLLAVDTTSGETVWTNRLTRPAGFLHIDASVSIANDLVYTCTRWGRIRGTNGGYLHAIDRNDGDEQWRLSIPSTVLSAPSIGQRMVFLTTFGGSLIAVSDGK